MIFLSFSPTSRLLLVIYSVVVTLVVVTLSLPATIILLLVTIFTLLVLVVLSLLLALLGPFVTIGRFFRKAVFIRSFVEVVSG